MRLEIRRRIAANGIKAKLIKKNEPDSTSKRKGIIMNMS